MNKKDKEVEIGYSKEARELILGITGRTITNARAMWDHDNDTFFVRITLDDGAYIIDVPTPPFNYELS